MRAHSDRDLVDRMAHRDEKALAELYDRYGPRLYGVAYSLVGEHADAEDVLADTFSQAWRGATGFDPRRGSVPAWLTVMVRSRALDLVRSKLRRDRATERAVRDAAEPPGFGAPAPGPGAGAEQLDRQHAVSQALQTLPDPQREAILLAYYEGLSQSEIARRLSEPLGTIKTRIRDGMRKLRETLRPLYVEHGL